MRLIFSVLTGIVIIAAAIVFVGPLFFSADDVRKQLFAQVEAATGYRLRVSGPVDITLFPSLNLVAEDVGVAQPASGSDAEFATAKQLKFGLKLWGLLDGKVQVTEVTLIDPIIAVPKAGAPTQAGGTDPVAALIEKEGDAQGQAGGLAPVAEKLRNLTLDELVIENGTVTLPPSGESAGKRIEKLDLEASLPAYDAPLAFDAAGVVDGKAMEANGSIGNFGQFLEGAPARVSLTVEAPDTLDAPASLSGTATYKQDTLTLSPFSAKSGDKTLAGTAVYKDDTVTLSQFTATAGRETFAGNAVYKDNMVTLNPLRANLRGNLLAGSVTANLANKVPYVEAALAAETLDVNALTGTAKSKPSGGGAGGGGGSAGGGGGGAGGGAGSAGWSNARIDFSPLRQVNGKFNLSAKQLVYDQIKVSPVTVQATMNGGKLNATLSKFNLYDGAGNAAVAIDASGKTTVQRVQLTLSKFNAYPFLKDAANFQNIEGRGTISLDLNASGASQRAIVSALGGTASLEFADGAIRGVNLARVIRNLGSGIVEGWQAGATEKTDFASLGASFKVAKGQATTQDLHLVGPLVRMTGKGTVNLPAKQLNFTVDPQLVASLQGQGAEQDLAGLGVPVKIVGPWAKPKIYPDIKGILENPVAAYERFKQFGNSLDKIDDTGALSNVLEDGKIDKDALIQGLGGLLNQNQPAATQPAAPATQTQPQAAAPPQAPAEPQPIIKDGKVNKDALIQGLGGILGGEEPAAQPQPQTQPKSAPQAQPQATAEPQAKPAKKKTPAQIKAEKKRQQKKQAEDAAKQLLENFLGQ